MRLDVLYTAIARMQEVWGSICTMCRRSETLSPPLQPRGRGSGAKLILTPMQQSKTIDVDIYSIAL